MNNDKWVVVPVEADDRMVEAAFVGRIESQDFMMQTRARARMKSDFSKMLAARPAGPEVPVPFLRADLAAIQSACDVVDAWATTGETLITLERIEALIAPLRRIITKEP